MPARGPTSVDAPARGLPGEKRLGYPQAASCPHARAHTPTDPAALLPAHAPHGTLTAHVPCTRRPALPASPSPSRTSSIARPRRSHRVIAVHAPSESDTLPSESDTRPASTLPMTSTPCPSRSHPFRVAHTPSESLTPPPSRAHAPHVSRSTPPVRVAYTPRVRLAHPPAMRRPHRPHPRHPHRPRPRHPHRPRLRHPHRPRLLKRDKRNLSRHPHRPRPRHPHRPRLLKRDKKNLSRHPHRPRPRHPHRPRPRRPHRPRPRHPPRGSDWLTRRVSAWQAEPPPPHQHVRRSRLTRTDLRLDYSLVALPRRRRCRRRPIRRWARVVWARRRGSAAATFDF